MSMNLYINGFHLYQTPTKVSYDLCQGNTYSVFAKYAKWLVAQTDNGSFDGFNGDLEKFEELKMVYKHLYELSEFIQNNPGARFGVG